MNFIDVLCIYRRPIHGLFDRPSEKQALKENTKKLVEEALEVAEDYATEEDEATEEHNEGVEEGTSETNEQDTEATYEEEQVVNYDPNDLYAIAV